MGRARSAPFDSSVVGHLLSSPEVNFHDIFNSPHNSLHVHNGSLKLILAVLEDAVREAMRLERCHRRTRDEAISWIFSNDREWPYAYLNLCDYLGIEPKRWRNALTRYAKSKQLGSWIENI